MMFALVAYDRPNAVARRLELRPEHLKHLDALGDTSSDIKHDLYPYTASSSSSAIPSCSPVRSSRRMAT